VVALRHATHAAADARAQAVTERLAQFLAGLEASTALYNSMAVALSHNSHSRLTASAVAAVVSRATRSRESAVIETVSQDLAALLRAGPSAASHDVDDDAETMRLRVTSLAERLQESFLAASGNRQ
jgi:hypothetical protein